MQERPLNSLRQEMISATHRLLASGIMQASHHGNLSMRVPGTKSFLLTAVGGLDDLKPENIALFDLDGNLLVGTVSPTTREIVEMHTVVYNLRDTARSVLHTHSPYATAFAVAGREIPLTYEPMTRILGGVPIPVAEYGPRGSRESVDNIGKVLKGHYETQALLLEHHGTLTFSDSPAQAVQANIILEEAALVTLTAEAVGGAKNIPPHKAAEAIQRRLEFEKTGTQTA